MARNCSPRPWSSAVTKELVCWTGKDDKSDVELCPFLAREVFLLFSGCLWLLLALWSLHPSGDQCEYVPYWFCSALSKSSGIWSPQFSLDLVFAQSRKPGKKKILLQNYYLKLLCNYYRPATDISDFLCLLPSWPVWPGLQLKFLLYCQSYLWLSQSCADEPAWPTRSHHFPGHSWVPRCGSVLTLLNHWWLWALITCGVASWGVFEKLIAWHNHE